MDNYSTSLELEQIITIKPRLLPLLGVVSQCLPHCRPNMLEAIQWILKSVGSLHNHQSVSDPFL